MCRIYLKLEIPAGSMQCAKNDLYFQNVFNLIYLTVKQTGGWGKGGERKEREDMSLSA